MHDTVHLLCRALRLAPACYRRFELAANKPHAQVGVMGTLWATDDNESGSDTGVDIVGTEFDCADLATAMGQFAAVESLSVQLSQDAPYMPLERVL